MRIKVLFFASLKELIGISSASIDLAEGGTTSTLFADLCIQYPSLRQGSMAIAVNKAYVTEDIVLKDGDEVALLPPISGG